MLTKIKEDPIARKSYFRCDCGRVVKEYESQVRSRARCPDCPLNKIDKLRRDLHHSSSKEAWFRGEVARIRSSMSDVDRRFDEERAALQSRLDSLEDRRRATLESVEDRLRAAETWEADHRARAERITARIAEAEAQVEEIKKDPRNVRFEDYQPNHLRDGVGLWKALSRVCQATRGVELPSGRSVDEELAELTRDAVVRSTPEALMAEEPAMARFWAAVDAAIAEAS